MKLFILIAYITILNSILFTFSISNGDNIQIDSSLKLNGQVKQNIEITNISNGVYRLVVTYVMNVIIDETLLLNYDSTCNVTEECNLSLGISCQPKGLTNRCICDSMNAWNGSFCENILKKSFSLDSSYPTALISLGNFLLVGFYNGNLELYDATNMQLIAPLSPHSARINSFKFIGQETLVSGSDDGKIITFNNKTFIVSTFVDNYNISVLTLDILPNQDLVCGLSDSSIKIFDIKNNNNTAKQILHSHNGSVRTISVLKTGDMATGGDDFSLKIWNTSSLSVKFSFDAHKNAILTSVEINDNLFATGDADGLIIIWNIENWLINETLKIHNCSVQSLIVLDNGYMVSASSDETIIIWNSNDFNQYKIFKSHTDKVNALNFVGNYLVSASSDSTIKLWDYNLIKTLF